MLELPPQVMQVLLDVGVARSEVEAAWASLSAGARHGLGLARRLLERGAADPAQLERALGGSAQPAPQRRRFADYEVVRELGRGAMGAVSLVVDPHGRQFALKTLAEVDDPVLIERFRREIRTMCALEHPHLAKIHDAGVLATTPYLVMEHYPGSSLDRHLAQGPLDPERAREIAIKLAGALAEVHNRGLVHRDIKPENVLFDEANEPRLADFGLATTGERSLQGGRLTLTAELLGTPAYMAPEQALDPRDVGPPADVYALGGVLYAMLTGQPPFVGKGGVIGVLQAVIHDPVTPPHQLNPKVPLALSELCVQALAKDPRSRPATSLAFAQMLSAERPAFVLPPAVVALVALTAVAVLGLVGLIVSRGSAGAAAPPRAASAPTLQVKVDLAGAGLPGAAWAAWTLEEGRDAAWIKRGEALLAAGYAPRADELQRVDLEPATESRWLVYLAARDTLSPRPLPQPIGRAARQFELVVAARQLKFAPGDLREAMVMLKDEERVRIVRRIENDIDTLTRALSRSPSDFDHTSPVDVATLELLVMPLAETVIYRRRRLDEDRRMAFSRMTPVKEILALAETLPAGPSRDAIELAEVCVAYLEAIDQRTNYASRERYSRDLIVSTTPYRYARMRRLSVQLRIWLVWWLIDSHLYAPELLEVRSLVDEVIHLQASMEHVTWQRRGLDGRRHLDEDEIYRRGTTLLLMHAYPTSATSPWPDFSDLIRVASRACGTNPRSLDLIALGNVLLASGDVERAETLLRRLKESDSPHEQAALRAGCLLQRARASQREERGELLRMASDALLRFEQRDWTRPLWAAWIDLLTLQGAPEADLRAAETAWTNAKSLGISPAPYLLFEPRQRPFVAREDAKALPFPPQR